jgi:hypothetical protein
MIIAQTVEIPATPQARSRVARKKLRELCKDSKLTVDSFLAMKHADRVLEAAIDEHGGPRDERP